VSCFLWSFKQTTYTGDWLLQPPVASLPSGGFVVVRDSYQQDGSECLRRGRASLLSFRLGMTTSAKKGCIAHMSPSGSSTCYPQSAR